MSMTHRRQTHLGPTCDRSLTIIDLLPPPSFTCDGYPSGKDVGTNAQSHTLLSIPATKTFIFQLPDELLVPIVELAAIGSETEPGMPHTTIWNKSIVLILSKVCHRLRRIAQPLLFRNIRLDYPNTMVPPSIPVLKLHRTLRERADLRQHCR
jgi:hypothetical protein